MRTWLLALLFVAFVSTPAYAHRRHQHHHHHHGHEHSTAIDGWHDDHVREKSNASRDSEQESRVPTGVSPNRELSPSDKNTAGDWLPPGWQQQPTDPKWQGKRFVSPDGTASFSAYITPVAQEPIAQHMKNVAFADGEQITHLRGERTWIEVSGFKGDRIFYRKSLLACGGTSWHEVALEYPAEAQSMNGFVDRVAKGVELDQDNGCAAAVATNNGSSNDSEQPPTAENRSSSSVNPSQNGGPQLQP
jgi:hypothetical protein